MSQQHPSNFPQGIYPENQMIQTAHDPRLHDINQTGSAYTQMSTPVSTSFLGMNFRDQQFWKGALLGAAVTLIVTNESVQKGIMKTVATLYGAVQGGVQEMKEKFEDVRAEIQQKAQEE